MLLALRIIYAKYWEDDKNEQVKCQELLNILNQADQEAEIKVFIPNGEQLYIHSVEKDDMCIKIYSNYPYSYK